MSLPDTVHASAVLLGETGILIRGPSGSGKSSLVMELLGGDAGTAHLVADDRVILSVLHGRLVADVPATLAGLVEVRGLGLVKLPHIAPVVIRLIVDIVAPENCPRLPDEAEARAAIGGLSLPRLSLPAGATRGRDRIHAAIGHFSGL
jgi:serine kinase of HPr protein (carbohydrate metabolism regulator)